MSYTHLTHNGNLKLTLRISPSRLKSNWEWPEEPERQKLLDMSPTKLSYNKTNWYCLYCDIAANQMQLKGHKTVLDYVML
ncbi:uncharacterized protein P174DRAFT_379220 [Aspergillus novofumigatus IBT 16806]|uniref:Uncharacterized protein n=1 Tax=Aspergillus novofumigatus (strain IBT 16806) TaxID=1392255 RepID=A0A2I1BUS2_ASPN1|nr:uncharacterized protein P174DRAFT_379220 [Aspergillus novofumigatus IBT 16806]PKX89147.1 hypothetical protein P174DRAFT_379220 [Aspergillus novofumigatus IBT 16806]